MEKQRIRYRAAIKAHADFLFEGGAPVPRRKSALRAGHGGEGTAAESGERTVLRGVHALFVGGFSPRDRLTGAAVSFTN